MRRGGGRRARRRGLAAGQAGEIRRGAGAGEGSWAGHGTCRSHLRRRPCRPPSLGSDERDDCTAVPAVVVMETWTAQIIPLTFAFLSRLPVSLYYY
jgi:hypothetical protein